MGGGVVETPTNPNPGEKTEEYWGGKGRCLAIGPAQWNAGSSVSTN